jgi:hypothetical protein
LPRYFPAFDFWNLELTHSGQNHRRFTGKRRARSGRKMVSSAALAKEDWSEFGVSVSTLATMSVAISVGQFSINISVSSIPHGDWVLLWLWQVSALFSSKTDAVMLGCQYN